MVKINPYLLPVKAHYFFFMAGMGPILPFLPVMGKQLGVSEVAMGLLMSVIPIFFLIAKPVFGFIVDYFQNQRKTVFLALVISTTVQFSLIKFVPHYKDVHVQTPCGSIAACHNNSDVGNSFCKLSYDNGSFPTKHIELANQTFCSMDSLTCPDPQMNVTLSCSQSSTEFYQSYPFWLFVILLSAGSVGYNVANSVSDAICFDLLGGGNEKKYGQQRVWGTVGFGLSALLGGYCIDWWSGPGDFKDYSPAFLLAITFTSVDVLCCSKLQLPELPVAANIIKDVITLVKDLSIATFLVFAAFLGICESFIIFFLFWYLEDLALAQGMMEHIKLLQGLTVAAETLIGEIIFFPLSGNILAAVGYKHCMSLCFLFYMLRLGLLSLISNPWWVLGVELLQGPSYALGYTTVVAYASNISPPGASATMQGIAAGMDDGFEKRCIYNPPKEAAELVAMAS
ncbi:major facilitator superfamily domain-containing protein 6 isoform X2 [Macrosteles quadrilineatus]|uniref:major facilitator superfamily domain-containing protein 6 isoform X2 n=1 Tax=Macrosteles quadrilineatus TaxID=74068 RepID=UPI0023E2856E|nr:major facilitator superfamily domain-containing protein 6 isoform X2 [Macrosteles quadrilineatus]